jgi:hypothetical protein
MQFLQGSRVFRRGFAGSCVVALIVTVVGCLGERDPSIDEEGALGTAEQALCSAQQQCPGGTTISCSSSGTSCQAGQDSGGLYVQCNGVKNYCPSCPGGCNSPPNSCYNSAGNCVNGQCSYTPKAAGTSCNDGSYCTSGDVCDGAGYCVGTYTCSMCGDGQCLNGETPASCPTDCCPSTGTCIEYGYYGYCTGLCGCCNSDANCGGATCILF